MLIRITSPDLVQCSMSGPMERWNPANSPPASPENAPEITMAASWYRRMRIPRKAVRSGFSRIDWRTAPKGDSTILRRTATAATTIASVK